jgi:hypothetical protein
VLTVAAGETKTTLTVTATSTVDATKSATATVSAGPGDPPTDITYTAVQTGGTDGTTDSASITLTFSAAVELEDSDVTVTDDIGAVTKGTLTGNGTTWSIPLSAVTTPGSVSVSIDKSGIESDAKPVVVYKAGVKVINRIDASIKNTFGITTTGATGVTDAFNAVHAYLSGRTAAQLASDEIIKLGDYIDLESLSVARYHTGAEARNENGNSITDAVNTDAVNGKIDIASNVELSGHGALLRLIVVGINSFNKYGTDGGSTGNADYIGGKTHGENGTAAHLVFQFQNVPGTHRMGRSYSNINGYPESEMRTYLVPFASTAGSGAFLTGLTAAGVPADVLWAPTRYVAVPSANGARAIQDKLWLPTEREMFGLQLYSSSYETAANQARLE